MAPSAIWKLELDGRTHSIELGDWRESSGLPGAVISDGVSHSLGPPLAGRYQMVSFEVGGHLAALQWAYRAHLVGVPLPFLGGDAVPATVDDWWTYELVVDGTSQGSWVLHQGEWSFVLPADKPTSSVTGWRPVPLRNVLLFMLLVTMVIGVLFFAFFHWVGTQI